MKSMLSYLIRCKGEGLDELLDGKRGKSISVVEGKTNRDEDKAWLFHHILGHLYFQIVRKMFHSVLKDMKMENSSSDVHKRTRSINHVVIIRKMPN